MSSALAYWTILMKDMKNYYLKPPNISWGIIFPISWTLMFFVRSEGPVDIRGILPGVMSLSVLFGTTSMLAVTITFERKSRSFERLLLAPISLKLLMLAKTTGAILFGIINAFIPVLFALLIVDLSGINWFLVSVSVLLIAVTSTFLGLFIAVSVNEVFEAQTFSNFFRFPMMFLCGLFIPIENLPVFLRPFSFILPLTYGADSLKHAINGNGIINPLVSVFILLGFAVFLFLISTRNIERRWIY
ncbi:ABC transporter permease [Mesotoga sp. B105.6.4]|uniref:ABC transporter permease n=1 Tax=Mesotoga sp. B105.6.4 TaxID=1582224 RepID=UPI000CCC9406|nr:ABC transporter permease [Mesotoga sp. B105.6.4]PNS39551.1 ABC transporter [Mesotoga sp. B105.6.4]RAM59243.1 ABC transporter [Mesotoga sp. SC_4PWA21]